MSINLNSLSARELDALISQAKKRRATLGKRKPVAMVRKKMVALARAEGYSIEELFGSPGAAAPRAATSPARSRKGKPLGKVAAKYRNPANPSQTWAGRGQHPRWMAEEIAKGSKAEDFLIP